MNGKLGTLTYGDSWRVIEFDDRVLAHLQIVINSKLRRHEGFFFSWVDSTDVGNGRSSIWLHNGVPLFFKYSTSERHEINREWLDELTASANSPHGLALTAEPGHSTPQPRSHV
jgi:hypothetical protein